LLGGLRGGLGRLLRALHVRVRLADESEHADVAAEVDEHRALVVQLRGIAPSAPCAT
jgi:hypothetical protein